MEKISQTDTAAVLDFTARLGRLMLENGAEINRTEETMERVATYFGVDSKEFFILSNGIFATGQSFAKAMFIPFKGTQLQKVAAANQLSRDIGAGKYSLAEAEEKLAEINALEMEKPTIQVLAAALGSGCFCAIFGGSLRDCIVATLSGFILWIFVVLAGRKKVSKIFTNVCGGALVTTICLVCYHLGLGDTISLMLVGSLIALVPGVPFTNGIKDISNEDYLAGSTRLIDAVVVFFCIAMGVSIVLLIYERIPGGITI